MPAAASRRRRVRPRSTTLDRSFVPGHDLTSARDDEAAALGLGGADLGEQRLADLDWHLQRELPVPSYSGNSVSASQWRGRTTEK